MNDITNISDVSTVTPDLPQFGDGAMLAKLRRKPMQTIRKMDDAVQDDVREYLGDKGITVSTKLFTEADSPVRKLITMDGQAYRFHITHTLPWVDAGPRLLLSKKWDVYAQGKNQFVDTQSRFLEQEVLPNWNNLVERDINFRRQAADSHADPAKREMLKARITESEYPTQEEAASKWSLIFRITALGGNDPREKLTRDQMEQARADWQLELADAKVLAAQDIAKRMAKPLVDAVEKLKVPIGEKGAVFRDSKIENIFEALETVKSFGFADDPAIAAAIEKADAYLNGSFPGTEAMRNMQGAREQAANSLDELSRIFTNLK